MSTTQKINRMLKRAGRIEKLVRGNGYYYIPESSADGLYINTLTSEDMELAVSFVEETISSVDGSPFTFPA